MEVKGQLYVPIAFRDKKNSHYSLNPLAPGLNPSAQSCLPRFFTEDFNV
jgi:hypothetical protein